MEPAEIPEMVISFDASRSELPEGIAIDKEGNIYVSLGPPLFAGGGFGEIWKISPNGEKTTLAQFDGGPPAAGLAVDASGSLYYAYPSGKEETQGVYRLTADGDSERLPGTEAIILANGIAFDNDANLYVSDSIMGTIWRIPPGESAELWFQHEWLAGCEESPIGANGVALWEEDLYAASTTKGLLVSIPILNDGSAGEPKIAAGTDECDEEFDDLDAMDGIALDVDGNIYALLVMQNKLVKINPADGSVTPLLTEENGLHNPASITFGIGDDKQSILFTNYAVLPPEPPASPGPAVLSVNVGVPGLPLP
jgi:sugar lactone lactonase YvrE